MKQPRPHQELAVTSAGNRLASGKRRPIVCAPVGAGKTFIASTIIRDALAKGQRVLFLVDALSLIDQTVAAFAEEGITAVGVIQADHPMTDASQPVQVASLATLRLRGMPPADLVVVDECHVRDAWLESIMTSGEWWDVPFIGLSATPWSRGLGLVWDDLIIAATMQELIDAGFLSPYRVYASAHPDLSRVRTVRGDYREDQLAEVMSEGGVVGDIVSTWLQLGEGRPTIAFCVNREHARLVQRRFQEAGVGWGYIDGTTGRNERDRIRRQLEAREIAGVANVGCLIKGVDWAIGCVILARPTRSEILLVQAVGRGMRVNEGIPDLIVLDHSDNTLRLGFVTDIHYDTLCTAGTRQRSTLACSRKLPRKCESCSILMPRHVQACPQCGHRAAAGPIKEREGILIRISSRKAKPTRAEKVRFYSELNWIRRERHSTEAWVRSVYQRKFGVLPASDMPKHLYVEPSSETRRFVKVGQFLTGAAA